MNVIQLRDGFGKILHPRREKLNEDYERQHREISRPGRQPNTNVVEPGTTDPPPQETPEFKRKPVASSKRRRRPRIFSRSEEADENKQASSSSPTQQQPLAERPPSSGSARSAPAQPSSNSEDETDSIEGLFRKAAKYIVDPEALEDALKKDDTDKALSLLFTEVLEIKKAILAAAAKNADKDAYEAVLDASRVRGALSLVLKKLRKESEEVRRLRVVEGEYEDVRQIISTCELDVPRSEMDKALKADGVKGGLQLLIQRYKQNNISDQVLRIVREKIRASFPEDIPRSNVEAAFRDGGAQRAFEYLMKCYIPYMGRSAELELVHRELGITRNILVSDGCKVSIDGLAADEAHKHLVGVLQAWIRKNGEQAERFRKELNTERALRSNVEDAKTTLERINAGYKTKQDQHEAAMEGLRARHKTDLDTTQTMWEEVLEDQRGKSERQAQRMRKSHAEALAMREAELQTEIDEARSRLQNLDSIHKGELDAKDEEIATERSTATSQLQSLRHSHKEDLARKDVELESQREKAAEQEQRLLQIQRTELERRDTTHRHEVTRVKGTLTSAKAAHKQREDELRRVNEAQKEEAAKQERILKELHEDSLAETEATHALELRRREEALSLERRTHQEAIDDLRIDMEIEKTKLTKQIEEMEEKYKKREVEMRREDKGEIEALKGALVAREHLKGLSDPEIWTRFKEVAAEIDRLSRIGWDRRKESSWPMAEANLRRSENQRKLKQHIVQSSIWMVLYEQIFYSPFQLFAEEGQEMYREWTDYFGKGKRGTGATALMLTLTDQGSEFSHWPEATKDSETWRYKKAKECFDAIKKPMNGFEDARRWKTIFDESLSATTNDICNTIDIVAAVTASERQRVKNLVRLAGDFWLEVTAQKYRVLLYYPPLGRKVLGNRMSFWTGTELVIQPEVRRRGNAQGQLLENEQVVKGCEEQKTAFPAGLV